MEIENYPVEKRVFHIDDECYIIYLGSHSDDYKPFLRIGNSKKLTREIIDQTYNIVITESYTGNPAIEPGNVNLEDLDNIRYVGEKNTINRFLDFMKHFQIETKNIAFDQEITAHDHNAVLYIYENGNVSLLYDGNRVFDLREREKKDFHFLQRTRWIKEQFHKNPLRYAGTDFTEPGFFKIQHSFFLFSKGQCFAFGLPENYFETLVQYGIDPDLISAVELNDASPEFIRICKRKKFLKESLSVLTSQSDLLQSTLRLFTAGKSDQLKFALHRTIEGSGKEIDGFTVKKSGPSFHITHRGIPIPIVFGTWSAGGKERVLILHDQNQASIVSGKKAAILPIAEGIPYSIKSETPDESRLADEYVSPLLSAFQDTLSQEDPIFLKSIHAFVEALATGINIGESAARLRKGVKEFKSTGKSPIPYVLGNIYGLCSLLEKRKEHEGGMKELSALRSAIKKQLAPLLSVSEHLPVFGECYIAEENLVILYRPLKMSVRSNDRTLAEDFVNDIKGFSIRNHAFFTDETARLEKLLTTLTSFPRKRAKKREERGEAAGEAERPVELPQEVSQVEKMATLGLKTAPSKKMPTLTTLLLIIAGLIVVAAAILFLPPLSLYKKSIGARETEMASIREEAQTETTEPSGTQGSEETSPPETGAEEPSGAGVTDITGQGIESLDKEKIESYLSLGYIQITILDVYKLTNKIALQNGYRALDSVEELGKDPDWIYPDNVFVLPDETKYTVVKGDTIWYIAKRFIKKQLDRDWKQYQELLEETDRADLSQERKNQIRDELSSLKESSYSENFVKEIDKTLSRL